MRVTAFLIVLSCLSAAGTARAQTQPIPPVPAAVVPPPPEPAPSRAGPLPNPEPSPNAVVAEPAPAAPVEAAIPDDSADDLPPLIKLVEKDETLKPGWHGAGMAEGGKIVVTEAGEGELTVLLTAAAYAHPLLGCDSIGVPTIRLVQVFDVTPPSPMNPWVMMTLSAKLDGYIRSEGHAGACLRVAGASVYPACGGPALTLGFQPACVADCGAMRCQGEIILPPLFVLAGRFVLVADLVPEATCHGVFRGHSEAIFAPGPRIGTWSPIRNPFVDLDGKNFGLFVLVKVIAAQ